MIEHNLDVIRNTDCVIGLGPEGDSKSGEVMVEGPPEEIALSPINYMGH